MSTREREERRSPQMAAVIADPITPVNRAGHTPIDGRRDHGLSNEVAGGPTRARLLRRRNHHAASAACGRPPDADHVSGEPEDEALALGERARSGRAI